MSVLNVANKYRVIVWEVNYNNSENYSSASVIK